MATTRREFLAGATAGTLLPIGTSAAAPGPNILLIVADDLGKEGLAVYGNPTHKTPNIDRLAREGMVFTRCFSSCNCSPSRGSILTGLYPHNHGIERSLSGLFRSTLDSALPNVARSLSDAGYRTCASGKWHLGDLTDNPLHPAEIGFDEFCLHAARLADRYWRDVADHNGLTVPVAGFSPDFYSQTIVDFMGTEPFLAYYPSLMVHKPLDGTPDSLPGIRHFTETVTYMDGLVGKLIDAAPAETVIIFTSDNGTHRDFSGGKNTLTDLGTNVPLIVRGPGIAPGTCRDLVDLTDLYPTICEIAGVPAPFVDGQSFAPQLYGLSSNPRDWVFIHCWNRKSKHPQWAIREQRWKLRKGGDLYDLSLDHRERHPLRWRDDDDTSRVARERLRASLPHLA